MYLTNLPEMDRVYICAWVKNENQLVYKCQDKSHDLWFHADVRQVSPKV